MITFRQYLQNTYQGWRFDGDVPTNETEFNERVLFDGVAAPSWSEVSSGFSAAKLEELRSERNQLLANTDWWASSDLTMTAEQTAYRQALRDITNTYSSLEDVVWPTKPE